VHVEIISVVDGEVVVGMEDNDVLTAAHNNVTLIGGLGDDQLFSQLGTSNTIMDGGAGIDLLRGDGSNDTASYASAPAGVIVDLFVEKDPDGNPLGIGVAFADGYGTLDGLIGIENVTGSAFADSLTGDDLTNVLQGGAGDDTLKGEGGADVFKYSFDLTQGGGGETFRFTDWLSEKFGRDFGDELPDFSPKHHHHDHQHGKDDKHHSKNDDHGKNDKHDNHGKDDGHHSKHGDHDHHHKHGCDDGHHVQDGGLTEKFFEKNYTEWLKEVVVPDLLAQGFVLDANGNGKIKIDINEDSRNGTPRIEGLTKDQLAEIFGDRDSVILRDGHEAEKAFYSNSYTSPGGGQDAVTSNDGFDTIVDFVWGTDQLEFNGLGAGFTLAEFTSLFNVSAVDADLDGSADDTVLALADGTWGVTLLNESGHTPAQFHDTSIFS